MTGFCFLCKFFLTHTNVFNKHWDFYIFGYKNQNIKKYLYNKSLNTS